MSSEWTCVTTSPEETQAIGKALGEACAGGEFFLLTGPLGAGKTCFVQGLAEGLGVRDYVHSPTFVLVAQHQGRLRLVHADLYRIESADEAIDLALEEQAGANGVCAVEWADREPSVFPAKHLLVTIEHLGGDRSGTTGLRRTERRIRFTATGRKHQTLLDALATAGVGGSR